MVRKFPGKEFRNIGEYLNFQNGNHLTRNHVHWKKVSNLSEAMRYANAGYSLVLWLRNVNLLWRELFKAMFINLNILQIRAHFVPRTTKVYILKNSQVVLCKLCDAQRTNCDFAFLQIYFANFRVNLLFHIL